MCPGAPCTPHKLRPLWLAGHNVFCCGTQPINSPCSVVVQLTSAMAAVREALADAKSPAKRENALHLIAALFNASPVAVEPFAVPLLPLVLERCSDKVPLCLP